jgi:hypothetical protein
MMGRIARQIRNTTFIGSMLFICIILNINISNKAYAMTLERNSEQDDVTTSDNESGKNNISVSDIDLGDYSEKMIVGEKQLLSVTILPHNASETDVTYSSSDDSIATINQMGRISAIKSGNTIIKVTCGRKEVSFILAVTEENMSELVSDIEIGEYEKKMYVDKTQTITATILPSDASTQTLYYRSSDEKIAKVSSTGEVKGISQGSAKIYVTAGKVTKVLDIAVCVATSEIKINSTFVVLKPNETYKLTSQVQPKEAFQEVTYSVVDTNVAEISVSGEIKAKNTGNTTILVTNKEYTTSVTVIVNTRYTTIDKNSRSLDSESTEKNFSYNIFAKEIDIVDWERLYDLYENKKDLLVQGEGYEITIKGNDIVNYKNELKTNIILRKDGKATLFSINDGDFLCGSMTLELYEESGKYVYLYNKSKEKYELLDINGNEKMIITTPGDYMVTPSKKSIGTDWVIYILITGVIVIIVGTIAYIVVKKKHWFW